MLTRGHKRKGIPDDILRIWGLSIGKPTGCISFNIEQLPLCPTLHMATITWGRACGTFPLPGCCMGVLCGPH
jgi:hypothetical protein